MRGTDAGMRRGDLLEVEMHMAHSGTPQQASNST